MDLRILPNTPLATLEEAEAPTAVIVASTDPERLPVSVIHPTLLAEAPSRTITTLTVAVAIPMVLATLGLAQIHTREVLSMMRSRKTPALVAVRSRNRSFHRSISRFGC